MEFERSFERRLETIAMSNRDSTNAVKGCGSRPRLEDRGPIPESQDTVKYCDLNIAQEVKIFGCYLKYIFFK